MAIALPQTWLSEELVLTLVESRVHAGQKVKDAWLKKIRRMDGSLASSSSPSLFCSAGRQWVASHGKWGLASLSILGEAVRLQMDQMITCLLSVSGLASPYQGFDLAFDVPKKSNFRSIDLSS